MTEHTSQDEGRPSKARRAHLRSTERKTHQTISNLVPIERYYTLASNILAEFDRAVSAQRLDDAFIFGRRFLTFSMEAIPKHDYYRNREKLKAANNADMHRVMDDMEKTVELMDLEELERREIRRR